MNLLQYTNGVGHLIVTLAFAAIGTALILVPYTDAPTKGIGVALLSTVSAAWFVPGAARQVVYQVSKQNLQQPAPPASETPAQPATPPVA